VPEPATRKRTPPGHLAAADDRLERLERELEALLVDEPADEQHELLLRRGEAAAERLEVVDRLQVDRVDPVRDHRDLALVEVVDVADVLAHVVRAGDHALRALRHPALGAVDVALRVLVDPALVTAVLGRVDRDDERAAEALGEVIAGDRDEPVVAMHEVEVEVVAELDSGGEHVGVHVFDPGDELAQVPRAARLANAVHGDAAADLLGRHRLVAARQDVDLGPERDERLGQLAHMTRKTALDDRRVLPREDQDAAHGSSNGAARTNGARPRSAASAEPSESRAASSAARWPLIRSSA
jgi:hypothetical protein